MIGNRNKIDLDNRAKTIREIMMSALRNEWEELPDKYGMDTQELEDFTVNAYVSNFANVIWKGGSTRFVKVFETELNIMVENKELTFEEVGFLTYISSKFTSIEDNIIKINDEYASRTELINELIKITDKSESYYKKLMSNLVKKKALFVLKNPNNKSKNIYYLSPFLFYKGKYMDKKVRDALIETIKNLDDNK